MSQSKKTSGKGSTGSRSGQNAPKIKIQKAPKAARGGRRQQSTPQPKLAAGKSWASVLSPCSKEYAMSLANPFLSGPSDVCIPDTPALNVRTMEVWTKGTFQTSTVAGALNTGYVALSPFDGIASDLNMVITNDQVNYNAPNMTVSVGGTNIVGFPSNSDQLVASFGTKKNQFRLATAGLRIMNITPEVSKGGFIVGLAEPGHQSIIGNASTPTVGLTINGMEAYKEAGRLNAASKEWSTLLYRPVSSTDLNFKNSVGGAFDGPDQYFMAFMVQAPSAGNQQLYQFEAVCHYELQGPTAIGKRPSHADPNGFAAANAVGILATDLHAPHQKKSEKLALQNVEAVGKYLSLNQSHQPSKAEIRALKKVEPKENELGKALEIATAVASSIDTEEMFEIGFDVLEGMSSLFL